LQFQDLQFIAEQIYQMLPITFV